MEKLITCTMVESLILLKYSLLLMQRVTERRNGLLFRYRKNFKRFDSGRFVKNSSASYFRLLVFFKEEIDFAFV